MSRVQSILLANMAALLTVGPVVHAAPRRGMTDNQSLIFDEVTKLRQTPRPYLGQTSEQREWNQAVDARKAAKKAGLR